MSVVVTGATGQFGRHVIESLLSRGLPADEIVAGGRNLAKLADLAAAGVRVALLDYDDADTLAAAMNGADKVLVVSGTDFGRRVEQHASAARAAADAGARLVAYTSAPHADSTSLAMAAEHLATEQAIRALGVPFVFLRNGWYFENYTAQIPTYLAQGAVLGAAADGPISGAARAEQAEAAAVVLLGEGHEGAVYELGGDTPFTLTELAALVSAHSRQRIVYRDVSDAEFTAALQAAGLPAPVAHLYADTDRAIRAGELLIETADLRRLIGRPTSTLADAVAAFFAATAVRA